MKILKMIFKRAININYKDKRNTNIEILALLVKVSFDGL